MKRLATGAALLVAALVTGWLTGSTGEDRIRTVTRVNTEENLVYDVHTTVSAAGPVAARPGEEGTASVEAGPGGSPEATDLVERMRRHLPALADWQAAEIRQYHKGYKKKLKDHSWGITAAMDKSPQEQRQAVSAMQELRRERKEFMRNLLGRTAWDQWHRIEITGGRDVDEFLRQLQERN